MNVTVVFDGDEEDAGRPLVDRASGARRGRGRRRSAAIGFEDGAGDPKTAVISRRSATEWTLTTTGYPGHASQIFHDDIGAGAIFEMSRILTDFYRNLSREPYLTFSPGLVLGGTLVHADSTGTAGTASGKTNVIAEQDDRDRRHADAVARSSSRRRSRRCARSCRITCRRRAARSRSTTATRRWRRPTATGGCWRCTTRRAATSARVR